ncbi:MAG: (d)CMP kinase [Alphaproteobacteria bacterium]|nr:(d)CMP kinase [Alphaproteobacteria bacterium]
MKKQGLKDMIITIDGPASAGKGTLAKKLADAMGYAYFDTGMVYRAVGLEMMLSGQDVEQESLAENFAKKLTFSKMISLSQKPEFRGPENGNNASKVAAYASVRAALLKMQQDFAQNPQLEDGSVAQGVIYDGRDTGTVVCPQADLKLFVTASSEVRAMRRHKEFLGKGLEISYEEVLRDVKSRDERDSGRAAAPLKPAADALIIDTSDLNAQEVFEKVSAIIADKN